MRKQKRSGIRKQKSPPPYPSPFKGEGKGGGAQTDKVRIVVTLKKSVLDPQGQTVQHALESLGFKGIACVRMGKYIEVAFNGKSENPKQAAEKMCKKLLANPVIEQYEIL